MNGGQGLLLDSYRHQGKAGGGGRATLCSTIGTVDSSFHKRGKCDRGGYVCLSFKCIHLFFFQFDLRCFLHRTCIKKKSMIKKLIPPVIASSVNYICSITATNIINLFLSIVEYELAFN